MSPFWQISHTADVGLLIRGQDVADLIIEGTKGLVLLLIKEYTATPRFWRDIELTAPDQDILLADFMSEVLLLAVDEHLAVVKTNIADIGQLDDGLVLKAKIGLMPIDKKKNPLAMEIKAVTYGGLEIKEIEDGLEATVLMDV